MAGVKDNNGDTLKEDGKFGVKTQNSLNLFWNERFPNEPNYWGGIVQTKTTDVPYPAISNYYTTPTANSSTFSSYPVTASHPKQAFDVTDDISIYKKKLRAAQKRQEKIERISNFTPEQRQQDKFAGLNQVVYEEQLWQDEQKKIARKQEREEAKRARRA